MSSATTNDDEPSASVASASGWREPPDGPERHRGVVSGTCQTSDACHLSNASGGSCLPLAGSVAISEADRPTNVVFFDGVCGLCNCFVDFVLSRDRRGAIRFAPLQGETAKCRPTAEFREPTTESPNLDTVVWHDAHGREFVRSAAAVRVLWQLGRVWWLIGGLLWLIPLPLREIGYRIIAANRYRLFGKKETCRLPTPAERDRFLP